MSKEFSRANRISEVVMREISLIIQNQVSDPRIGMVTISHVRITSDLKCAKLFITSLNFYSEENIKECLKCLSNASGFIRKILSKRMRLRVIPKLYFFYDYSLEYGFYMDDLIFKANNIADN